MWVQGSIGDWKVSKLFTLLSLSYSVFVLGRIDRQTETRNFVRVLGFLQRALIIGNLSKYIVFYDGSKTAYFFYFIYAGPNPLLFCLIFKNTSVVNHRRGLTAGICWGNSTGSAHDTLWKRQIFSPLGRRGGGCFPNILVFWASTLWMAGGIPPSWRPPQPEVWDPVAPLKGKNSTQDSRLSPLLSWSWLLCIREFYNKPSVTVLITE